MTTTIKTAIHKASRILGVVTVLGAATAGYAQRAPNRVPVPVPSPTYNRPDVVTNNAFNSWNFRHETARERMMRLRREARERRLWEMRHRFDHNYTPFQYDGR